MLTVETVRYKIPQNEMRCDILSQTFVLQTGVSLGNLFHQ